MPQNPSSSTGFCNPRWGEDHPRPATDLRPIATPFHLPACSAIRQSPEIRSTNRRSDTPSPRTGPLSSAPRIVHISTAPRANTGFDHTYVWTNPRGERLRDLCRSRPFVRHRGYVDNAHRCAPAVPAAHFPSLHFPRRSCPVSHNPTATDSAKVGLSCVTPVTIKTSQMSAHCLRRRRPVSPGWRRFPIRQAARTHRVNHAIASKTRSDVGNDFPMTRGNPRPLGKSSHTMQRCCLCVRQRGRYFRCHTVFKCGRKGVSRNRRGVQCRGASPVIQNGFL